MNIIERVAIMLGLKAAKTEAANKFRYAIDKFESTVAKADDCVTRVQMKSGEAEKR